MQPRGAEKHLLNILRNRAAREQNNLCHWCAGPMNPSTNPTDPLRLSGDHLIPVHAGGRTVVGNIVAAHARCNSERHPDLQTGNVSSGDVKVESSLSEQLRLYTQQQR